MIIRLSISRKSSVAFISLIAGLLPTACSPQQKVAVEAVDDDASSTAKENNAAAVSPQTDCVPNWMPAATPSICNWTGQTALPQALAYASGAAFNNALFIVGGYYLDQDQSVAYNATLYGAAIDPDTGAVGAWRNMGQINQGRSGAGVAVTPNCFVVAAGAWSNANGFEYGADVQTSPINMPGPQAIFTTSPNKLNTPRSNLTLLYNESSGQGFLYAVAGVTQKGADTVHLDNLEYATIDSNCNVGAWTTMNFDVKGGRSSPQAVLNDNTLYVIGGWGDLDLVDIYSDVQYTTIRDDGSIAPWSTAANRLRNGIYAHGANFYPDPNGGTADMFIINGGQESTGLYSDTVAYAYLGAGPQRMTAPGPWTSYFTPLTAPRAGHVSLISNNTLYVIGGLGGSAVYLSSVESTAIEPGTP